MATYWFFLFFYRSLTRPGSGLKWLRLTSLSILRGRRISATGSGYVLGFSNFYRSLPFRLLKDKSFQDGSVFRYSRRTTPNHLTNTMFLGIGEFEGKNSFFKRVFPAKALLYSSLPELVEYYPKPVVNLLIQRKNIN